MSRNYTDGQAIKNGFVLLIEVSFIDMVMPKVSELLAKLCDKTI